jgi:hypothetical protein
MTYRKGLSLVWTVVALSIALAIMWAGLESTIKEEARKSRPTTQPTATQLAATQSTTKSAEIATELPVGITTVSRFEYVKNGKRYEVVAYPSSTGGCVMVVAPVTTTTKPSMTRPSVERE